MANFSTMKVKELVAHCKANKIKSYSGLSKDGLIHLIETGRKPAPKEGSAAKLREVCRDVLGLKGYSGLNTAELKEAVANKTIPAPKVGSVRELRAKVKAAGIPGCSGLGKDKLAEALKTGKKPAPKENTAAYYKALLTKHNVANRSKLTKKDDMIVKLFELGIIDEDYNLTKVAA